MAGAEIRSHEVRDQAKRILCSPVFAATERLRRFLSFTVEETLAGRGSRLKEYVVATEVFDREETYDPASDALVRVEARRLRAKLLEYYRAHGRGDPILIDYPKGAYVPVFTRRKMAAGSARWAPRRIALVSMAVLGGVAIALLHLRPGNRPRSVAVLPFRNLNSYPGSEYFPEGLADDISTALQRDSGVEVLARPSAAQLAAKGADLRFLPDQYAGGILLEGTLRSEENRLRVTARLVNMASRTTLWTDAFDLEWKKTLAMQEEIAGTIVAAVRPFLGSKPAGDPTASLDAETASLYATGIYLRDRRTEAAVRRSVGYFERALRRRPRFAPAWAALAAAQAYMGFHRWERHDAIFPQARLSAQNALKIDSALAEAHEALGWVAWLYELKWDDAESHFKRAIEIDRNSAHARQAYALSLTARGRFDEAIAQFQRAAELDSDVAGFNDQAVILYCARRFDEAARAAQLTLEMKPDYAPARVMLGMCAEAQGQYAEAIPHLERAAGMAGRESNVLGRLAYAYARSGRRAEARKLVHEMAAKPSTFQIHLAHAYAGLDDRVRLFEALEKAREQSETELLFCAVEPLFDGLHGDSRFKALLVKLGLR